MEMLRGSGMMCFTMAKEGSFAVASPVALREECSGPVLRRSAVSSKDANQTRRVPSLAVVYDSGERRDTALVGVVTLQIIGDWVLRFSAKGRRR